ncbi:MAG: 5-(carboxyamino)imidazole ribonucleotide synthase [Pirellulaceae bacterium]
MASPYPSSAQEMILPGRTLGVLGGGQLGRMFAHAAQRMGYHVGVFCQESGGPASQAADWEVVAPWDDLDAVERFAKRVDCVTLESENIPLSVVQTALRFAPVRPGARALEISQHRIREKQTLQQAGIEVTPFLPVHQPEDLKEAAKLLGAPFILKTATMGYDGKGQRLIESIDEAETILKAMGGNQWIAEKRIELAAEVSVLVARSPSGATACYPTFLNTHRNHILDITQAPVPSVWNQSADDAQVMALRVVELLSLEGLLCVEFFIDSSGAVMVNELAPRPHNSGHLTIDACLTRQFEQQVRAICNLPLRDTQLLQPAAMANLLGDLWQGDHPPAWNRCLESSACWLHLYGKEKAATGRKMGHLTAMASTAQQAAERVVAMRDRLDVK